MALVLTITTGRIGRERTEAFQVTFRTLLSRRFEEAPFLRQALLVHLGEGVWQMQTLWESTLAQTHPVDNDVPLTVRIFREFGAEPEICLADVSAFLQPPPPVRPTLPGERRRSRSVWTPLRRRREEMTERPDHELRVLEVDQTVPPRPEEEIADVGRDSDATNADRDATWFLKT